MSFVGSYRRIGAVVAPVLAVTLPMPTRGIADTGTSTRDSVSWSRFAFDNANRGYNPFETVLSTSNVKGLHQLWKATTEGELSGSPVLVGDVVYVGSSDRSLYAFKASNGTLKWKARLGDEVEATPAVVEGVVYVGCWDGYLYAFDASTGALRWKARTGGPIDAGSPLVAGGIVYASSLDGKLYAFDAATGTPRWVTVTHGEINHGPALANGLLYVGSL